MQRQYLCKIVCIFVVSSFFASFTGILAGADSKNDKKIEVDYKTADIDYRDGIIKASTKGKFNVVMTSDLKGVVSVSIKKIEPLNALNLFLAISKSTSVEKGSFRIITPQNNTFEGKLPEISLKKSGKFKKNTIRKAEIRPLLLQLFELGETDVILGQSVSGHVVLRTEDVDLKELIQIVMYTGKLISKPVNGTLFIGSKAEVDSIK